MTESQMTPNMQRQQPWSLALDAAAREQAEQSRWRFRGTLVGHELLAALRIVGMRDRLRCPDCRAVGTWKPHGGWYDRRHGDARAVRRWMCKCCGRYEGPEGVRRVRPNATRGYWDFVHGDDEFGPTPKQILSDVKLWPWIG